MRTRQVILPIALLIAFLALVPPTAQGHFPAAGKGVIEGFVWLPDGKPAAGAKIHCELYGMRMSRELGGDLKLDAVSTEAGAYHLDVLDEGAYLLRVELPGYASALSDLVYPGEPTDFYLTTGQKVFGRVATAETHEPIFRARVYMIYKYDRIGPVETNRNGEFRFLHAPLVEIDALFVEGLHIGWVNIEAQHLKVTDEQPVEFNFELQHGNSVTGRVTNVVTEKPMPNLKLTFSSAQRGEQSTETDEKGFYRIEGVAPGVVTARVDDPAVDLLDPRRARAWSNQGAATVLDFQVTPRVKVSGIVKNARGEPVPNATLDFTVNYGLDYVNRGRTPRPLPLPGAVRLFASSVRTGPDGTFSAAPVTSGQYTPVAWADGYVITPGEPFTVSPRKAAEGIQVVLQDGVTLQGTVSDPVGAPILNVQIHARPNLADTGFDKDPLLEDVIVYTDAQGRYVARGLPTRSKVTLHARAPGYVVASGDFTEAEEGQTVTKDFTMEKSPLLSGTITDSAGRPVKRVAVKISGTPDRTRTDQVIAMTDQEGRYSSPGAGLPPYTLTVEHPFYNPELVRDVKPADGINFTLHRYGAVEGEFVNYPKDYRHSIMVAAKTTDGARTKTVNFPGETIQFKITKLYPGTYTLFGVDHEGKYEARCEPFEVKEDAVVTGLKLYFKRATN